MPYGEGYIYDNVLPYITKNSEKNTAQFTSTTTVPATDTHSNAHPSTNTVAHTTADTAAHTATGAWEYYSVSHVTRGGVGAIIVAGDIFDFTVLSPYTATAMRLPTVDEELERAGALLLTLRRIAPVYVVAGNHDDRLVKKLGSHMSYEALVYAAMQKAQRRGAGQWDAGQQLHPIVVTDRDYVFVGHDVCVAHLSMARGHGVAMKMAARAALRLRRHVVFGHTHRQGAQREDGSPYWGIGIGSCVGDMWYGQKYLRDTILYNRDGAFTQRGFALLIPRHDTYATVVYNDHGVPVFVKDGEVVICRDTFIGKRVLVWE